MKTAAKMLPAELFSVREYGEILRGGNSNSLDQVSLKELDWDWLSNYSVGRKTGETELFRPIFRGGKNALQPRNYVGVIRLPTGGSLEILPKTADSFPLEQSRSLVMRMLAILEKIPHADGQIADLRTANDNLLEVLIGIFLDEADQLVSRGLRSDYVRLEGDEPFLRGKLILMKELVKPTYRRNRFSIEYDEYLLDRPENRLLVWSLYRVASWTQSPRNKRASQRLLKRLSEIPESRNPIEDLRSWAVDRTAGDYVGVRPWIELIVHKLSPRVWAGESQGISFLFPMNTLFERFVGFHLRKQIAPGYTIDEQPTSQWLAKHRNQDWFNLRPDIVIGQRDGAKVVIDVKWKRLESDEGSRTAKYNLGVEDIYQMFVYAKRYLTAGSSVFLVYPKTNTFRMPLAPFHFQEDQTLWVVPFDLDRNQLVPGDWTKECDWLGNSIVADVA